MLYSRQIYTSVFICFLSNLRIKGSNVGTDASGALPSVFFETLDALLDVEIDCPEINEINSLDRKSVV